MSCRNHPVEGYTFLQQYLKSLREKSSFKDENSLFGLTRLKRVSLFIFSRRRRLRSRILPEKTNKNSQETIFYSMDWGLMKHISDWKPEWSEKFSKRINIKKLSSRSETFHKIEENCSSKIDFTNFSSIPYYLISGRQITLKILGGDSKLRCGGSAPLAIPWLRH